MHGAAMGAGFRRRPVPCIGGGASLEDRPGTRRGPSARSCAAVAGLDIGQIGQVPVPSIDVETVSDHPAIGNAQAREVRLDRNRPSARLVEQDAGTYVGGLPFAEAREDAAQAQTRVQDVLDEEDASPL